jgi:chromosome segregation ATPase
VSQTTSEISELEEFIKSKVQASTAASSDQEKYIELLEAQEAIRKQEELKLEVQELIKMADSVDQVIKQGEIARGKDQLTEIKSAFESAISSGKQGDAWKGLAEKSEAIRATMDNKSANIIERNVSRQVEVEQQLATERNKRTAIEADKEKVENEVYQLNLTLNAAKKKDQPTIQSAIDKKKEEIQLLEEEIAAAEPKETVLTNQLNKLKAELTVIQKATDSQSTSIKTTRQEVLKEFSATNSTNSSSLHAFVDQQIGELIKNNPELKVYNMGSPGNNNAIIARSAIYKAKQLIKEGVIVLKFKRCYICKSKILPTEHFSKCMSCFQKDGSGLSGKLLIPL